VSIETTLIPMEVYSIHEIEELYICSWMLENFTHFSHGITISSLGAVWEGFSQNGFTCEVKVDETKKLASPGFEFILA